MLFSQQQFPASRSVGISYTAHGTSQQNG